MVTTVNQLRVELNAIQSAHEQLNTFFWGSFERSQDELPTGITYPLMCCYYNSGGSASGNIVSVNLVIVIADRVYDDFSNLNDTESDTLQVCKDVINVMQTSPRWNRIGRVQSASVRKFIEAREDKVTGHYIDMNFVLFDSRSVCDIPMPGYDFDGNFQSTCEPVFITNSDGSFELYVDAGNTYTAVDTVLNISFNGGPAEQVTVPYNTDETINVNVQWQLT